MLVQTSREFCAAPVSLTPTDDETSPPGPETFGLHPTDIIRLEMHLKKLALAQFNFEACFFKFLE